MSSRFPYPATFLPLCAALAVSAAAQTAKPAAPAVPGKEDPVQLAAFDVTADKENNFSLPLDAVATSGSRLGLTSRDLPASISVITQEMMQLRGLRTAVEAVEAAVGMTGGTQFGSIPSYSTRGFGGNNVTIMRDGIRQNTASQSSRTVDSFILDRIEVLKGPDGLMFGEGAIGGAVNYISKSPSPVFRGDGLASVGPWGSYLLGLGVGGPLNSTPNSQRSTPNPRLPTPFPTAPTTPTTAPTATRNGTRSATTPSPFPSPGRVPRNSRSRGGAPSSTTGTRATTATRRSTTASSTPSSPTPSPKSAPSIPRPTA